MQKLAIYLAIFLIPFLSTNSSDDILKGIPDRFDPEYIRDFDYPYYTLDKVLSTFYDERKFGENICTIGYISRDTSYPVENGNLLLQRIFVTCCLAHASPVTIYIKPMTDLYLADSTWIKINGTVNGVTNNLGTTPCIIADRIEIIPKPSNQYLNCNACPAEH
ncbi:MAG: hypothetical protein KIT33_04020 [Candidatus Kapabacteria bacterium]|nr:hypothetical protein [Ignavibacteriota bacterium]MCW5884121.1 hypothetical protein [Candidatus Kapabacteria bacterium]